MRVPIEATISDSRLARMVTAVSEKDPLFGKVISKHAAAPLGEYAAEMRRHLSYEPIQPRYEVINAVATEAQRTLGKIEGGPALIRRLKRQLLRAPVFLTGNHHGPDFAASMHQGTEIFGLAVESDSVIPVLAGGTVHLNSELTRPSSILLAGGIRKVNIFTGKKHKEKMMTAAPAFGAEMVEKAKSTVKGQRGYGYSPKEADAVTAILDKSYMPITESGLDNFSDQSVLLNRLLWQQAHSDELTGKIPELAFLELEGVTTQLLFTDLHNRNTITYQALFDREFRNTILKNLDGVNGCWDNIIAQGEADTETVQQKPNSKGTTFFWGINSDGSRYSFHYEEDHSKGFLVGTKKDGSTSKIELSEGKGPDELIARLERTSGDRIIPSMFTVFLEIAFAHGFKCEGGKVQMDYLTRMKSGLISALEVTGRNEWAEKVQLVPTRNYVTGLATTYANYSDGSTHRAGLVEVIANGGYTMADVTKMRSLTVAEAALTNFSRSYRGRVPREEKETDLISIDEKVIFDYLGDKAILMSI